MKYFLRYKTNTLFSLGNRIAHAKGITQAGEFSLPMQKIIMYEILGPVSNGMAFSGLGFDGYIEGDTPHEAIMRMYNSINLILCLCSYTTMSPYNKVLLTNIYEADENLVEKKFNYYFYPAFSDELLKSIRPVDMNLFTAAWNNGDNSIFTLNVLNALYQLNKSLEEDMISDEFLSLWNGIEYLVNTINKKYSITETKQYIKCRKCGTDVLKCLSCGHEFNEEVKTKGRFDGIRMLAQNKLALSKNKFDKLHSIRSILLHDGNFKPEWYESIPLVRDLLIWVIAEAINLQDTHVKKILKLTPKKNNLDSNANKIIHSSILLGLDTLPSIESISSQPTLNYEVKGGNSELSVNKDGSVTSTNKMDFKYSAPQGVHFNKIVGEVWLPKESGVTSVDLDFK